ncbi:MAG: SCP2 sterol-binding domain-containing protein, partial [Myxococcota bacterium]|nr:SCP2 sterol-binding domain-containing protein [Myxococcota bacterium]
RTRADLMNLPRMIRPAALAELLAEARAEVEPPADATADRVAVAVTGPGGGDWHMGVTDGAFDIVDGTTDQPLVTLTLAVSDWREFVAGRVRDLVRAHTNAALLDPRALTRLQGSGERVSRLRGFTGDVQVIVEDSEEDAEYTVTFTLGGGAANLAQPTTTIRVDLAYLGRLASGEENVQNAFFAGKIRIDGDMNLAMGLMTAVM